MKRRREGRTIGIIVIFNTRFTGNTEGIWFYCLCIQTFRQQGNRHLVVLGKHRILRCIRIGSLHRYSTCLYPHQRGTVHTGYTHPRLFVLHNKRHGKIGPGINKRLFESRLLAGKRIREIHGQGSIPFHFAPRRFPIRRITDNQDAVLSFGPTGIEPYLTCPRVD